jgi:thiol-disulfide isomerase/thioredoxin
LPALVCFCGLFVAGTVFADGDSKSAPAPGKKEAAKNDSAKTDADKSDASKSDPYAVPDGTPEELFAFIDGLKKKPVAQPRDMKSMMAHMETMRRTGAAILAATDKILAAKPTEEQTAKALKLQLGAILSQPMFFMNAELVAKLEKLPDALKAANLPKEAAQARGACLSAKLQAISMGGPKVSEKKFEKLIDQVKDYFASEPVDPSWQSIAMTAGRAAESCDKEHAGKTYRELATILAAKHDKALTDLALGLEGAARRLELTENAMRVEGTMLDGKPLDWSKYSGKIVLIDFWATWCGPCRAELPNVKKAYKLYHDRGFEVVGISLDSKREALDKFMDKEKLPWTIVLDDSWNKDKKADADSGSEVASHMARYYGVFGIPTAILLGKDGRAVSLNARGPELMNQLEKLLGPAETKPEESKPASGKSATNKPASSKNG